MEKHIVVIGGGPAGMEAARVAGKRGHKVTLFEKAEKLGGQVRIAAKAAHRHRFAEIVDYLALQLHKLPNVRIELGYEASKESISNLRPDTVIVATGSLPMLPKIPGIEAIEALTIDQALGNHRFAPGDRVIIVDESWLLHSLSLADLLTDQDVAVTLITSQEFAGNGLDLVNLTSYHSRLALKHVPIQSWTEVIYCANNCIVTRNILTGKKQYIEDFHAIVFTHNRQPNRELSDVIAGVCPNVISIGDCIFPRGIEVAMFEGHKIGLMV